MKLRAASHFVGILGWPLDFTLSPIIHAAAFRRLGLDWVYLAWPVPPEGLADAVAGLRGLGAIGANVTMPHKENAAEMMDELSGDARIVGAVNTIHRIGDRLVGHNTDVDGFREFLLADAGVDVAGCSAIVLGAGGAARAVVRALDDLGAGQITIAARRPERGAQLAQLVGRAGAAVRAWDDAIQDLSDADMIVNTTPIGTDGADPVPGVAFRKEQVVVDLIYSPPSTPLVERARTDGAKAWGGLGMLVHQAATSFRIWTGQDPPIEVMSAAAVHALRAQGRGVGND